MARASRRAGFLKLPPMMDIAGVQLGIVRVQVALEADHIDIGFARLLRWAMRLAATNIRFAQQQQGQALRSFTAGAKGLGTSKTARRKSKQLY